jgi:hypothetical protein
MDSQLEIVCTVGQNGQTVGTISEDGRRPGYFSMVSQRIAALRRRRSRGPKAKTFRNWRAALTSDPLYLSRAE